MPTEGFPVNLLFSGIYDRQYHNFRVTLDKGCLVLSRLHHMWQNQLWGIYYVGFAM